jgi:hypothetical protein
LFIQPGDAHADRIREFFAALNDLYHALGGGGSLRFTIDGGRAVAMASEPV